MFQIDEYIGELTSRLKSAFGERLVYIGLQGSYLRGEATPNSDIDIMAVIDRLSPEDLKTYRNALAAAGNFEKSCGFICGKSDLANWNPLEIFHLLNATKDYYGELKTLVSAYTAEDEKNYVKLSLNNLFHEICHRYIHADRERNISHLPPTCKSVFFIMQHLHYLNSGVFVQTKRELLQRVRGEDKAVLELCLSLQNNADYDFDSAFSLLFNWCQSSLSKI
ncbi:MAG: nucleotidyltransferase domain-containing protein [Ruminococcus sp.]|nr:nucleotidyltransferase domain-containing protein [Ruminococcus sp.]MCM1380428.1 nucleotidyltransferase domain-containing protein [Muribaculaceae bacterium]MCM1478142.1 nucleotidyltransferase domain-containing protein [Muribaculaceae bacterium]